MMALSRKQVVRLGGLAQSQKLSSDQRSLVAAKGGQAFMQKYGKEGVARARLGLKVKR